MMNDMMRVLRVHPHDVTCQHTDSAYSAASPPHATSTRRHRSSHALPLPAHRLHVLSAYSDEECIEDVDAEESGSMHRDSAQHSASPLRSTTHRSSAAVHPHTSVPVTSRFAQHRASLRQPHSPAASPAPVRPPAARPSLDLSPTPPRPYRATHPPLASTLQAELERMRRQQDRWRERAKTTRTQRMREEAVERRRGEEGREARRREEEGVEERRKRELVERAMVERWGVRGRREQQSPSARRADELSRQSSTPPPTTARLEWIRKRDGMARATSREQPLLSDSRRASSSARGGQRQPGGSGSDRDDSVDEWRYADERRSMYSARYLRTLGYDVASDEESEQNMQRRSDYARPFPRGDNLHERKQRDTLSN